MFDSTITIAGIAFRTYTLLFFLVSSGAIVSLLLRAPAGQRAARMDIALGGVFGGLLLARLTHVALHSTYFTFHTDEILRLSAGGLDWRGAVIGAIFGLGIGARQRGIALGDLLDEGTLLLPLFALAGWWGCAAALCAYGAEVERMAAYPAGMTWEAMDSFGLIAPRFQVQPLGMMVAVGLLLLALILRALPGLAGRRFWIILGLLAFSMAALSLLRGDAMPRVYGMRVDLWLDMGLGSAALLLALRAPRQPSASGVVSKVWSSTAPSSTVDS